MNAKVIWAHGCKDAVAVVMAALVMTAFVMTTTGVFLKLDTAASSAAPISCWCKAFLSCTEPTASTQPADCQKFLEQSGLSAMMQQCLMSSPFQTEGQQLHAKQWLTSPNAWPIHPGCNIKRRGTEAKDTGGRWGQETNNINNLLAVKCDTSRHMLFYIMRLRLSAAPCRKWWTSCLRCCIYSH